MSIAIMNTFLVAGGFERLCKGFLIFINLKTRYNLYDGLMYFLAFVSIISVAYRVSGFLWIQQKIV